MKLKITLLLWLLLTLAACNSDVTIIGSNSSSSEWYAPFTQILSKSDQIANGVSVSVIKLQVFNQDNTPLAGVIINATPQSANINFINCTASDTNGITFCSFTSTVPETANIDLSSGDETFTTDITFIAPPVKQSTMRISYSPIIHQTNSSYSSITGFNQLNWAQYSDAQFTVNTESPYYKLEF